jgi:hypothetical protein
MLRLQNAKLDKTNIPLSGFGAATCNLGRSFSTLNGVKEYYWQDAATKTM